MEQKFLDVVLNPINIVFELFFLIWVGLSIYWIYKLKKSKNLNIVNPHLYDAIPSVFTTIGVCGTFVGVFIGLWDFDVNTITDSIPILLEGLKTAFWTSIIGLVLSFIFGRWSQRILHIVEKESATSANNELGALQEIIKVLQESKKEADKNAQILNKSLVGDTDDSLSTQLVKLRGQTTDNQKILEKMQLALGGDTETSLLTQIQKLRVEQNDYSNETKKNIEWIVKSMNENNRLISKKFDEFADLLAKNNTEALVNVMKDATEQFNRQMTAIVEKLVQENFQELNNSVQRMNQWQQENKEIITQLTEQFKSVSEDFKISSSSIKEITDNTNKLTNDNSHLTNLIKELQKVMIEDTKYQEIITKLTSTIETLKENTDAFDETTNKLNNWVKNQMNFSDSVAKLLTRLEEIEKIKDINEIFWSSTKKQLNEGVNIIANASKTLSNDLENINDEFYARLNDTLQNLDTLIQRIVANYRK